MAPDKPDSSTPLAAGLACYVIWGFVPLAFQAIGRLGVGPWEILAHRTLWGAPTALIFVLIAGQFRQVLAVFSNPRLLAGLMLSCALIAINWIVFIWAVNSGHVLESSLGYYITPLINMAAGVLIFRERMDRVGLAAIVLAAAGVAVQAVALGQLPWVSLILAFSFGGYGIVRKQVAADAQTGLFIECLLLAIPSLAYAAWLASQGQGHFGATPAATAWLVAAGPITAIPLVLFSWAARRIPLSYMGFLQFISPTMAFVIGVAEGEAFTPLRAVSFLFIWAGALTFTYGAWRRTRLATRPA
ncbi:MAG TPA: EamA family transporter RarD [Phenylobacterium sp.]|nr:EamA family transporter RarD [Phenylobacterium sp.]